MVVFGGVGDAGFLVGVDGGEGAEEKRVDVGENGSAARGDVVVSEELVEAAEGIVDALGGLEVLGVGEEGSLEVERVGFFEREHVGATEKVARFDGKLAAAA